MKFPNKKRLHLYKVSLESVAQCKEGLYRQLGSLTLTTVSQFDWDRAINNLFPNKWVWCFCLKIVKLRVYTLMVSLNSVIGRSVIWAIINDFHFFPNLIGLMLIVNEIKFGAYIKGHRNDVFSLAGWGSDHIMVHNSDRSPSAACKLLLAIFSTHTSTSTIHTLPFTTLQQLTILLRGWLQTESTKTGCTHFHKREGLNTRAWCFSLLSCNCQWLRIFWLSRK